MTYGSLIGVHPLQPHDAFNYTAEGHIQHQKRDSAAEVGSYEVLERHNFHTVASSQSYDAVALIIKIMNILHVNVAENPLPWDPLRRECSSLLALYLLIMQRYLLLAINAIEALLATVISPYPS